MAQVTLGARPVLLVAYDSEYPEPLRGKRPIPDTFGVALVLSASRGVRSIAGIDAHIDTEPADTLADPRLEALRTAIPAARALPLLRSLAAREASRVSLDYLDDTRLTVKLTPCD